MRELDELLCRYLHSAYDGAAPSEKEAFCSLLALPDPDLIGYLLGAESHDDPDIADVIEQIRSRPEAGP